jgi:hypothetical protein
MVIGGQAVLLYGEPRLTRDIDVTLGLGTDGLPRILEVARSLGLVVLPEQPAEFVRETMVLPASDPESGLRVDFIFSFSSYEQEALARAVEVTQGSVAVRFATLEDVVIHKIIAGRPRDIEDVRSVLLRNPTYDQAYVLRWLMDFDQALTRDFAATFRRIAAESKTGRFPGDDDSA